MKLILNEKYLLEETNLLCEADDDFSLSGNDKDYTIANATIKTLEALRQNLETFIDSFLDATGDGFALDTMDLKDIEGEYKEFAGKLDAFKTALDESLNRIEEDRESKEGKLSDQTIKNNKELNRIFNELEALLNKNKLNTKITADNIKQVISSSDKNITLITDVLNSLIRVTDFTNKEEDQTAKKGGINKWQEYLVKAKKDGHLDEAWDYYLDTMWKDDKDKIKNLGKAFKIEVMNYGDNGKRDGNSNDNPFINFICRSKSSDIGIFNLLNEGNYGHIHNALVDDKLRDSDVAGTGKLGTNNIIYKKDFYNYKGKDLDTLLRAQNSVYLSLLYGNDSKANLKAALRCLYMDYDDLDPAEPENPAEATPKEITPPIMLDKKLKQAGVKNRQEMNNDVILKTAQEIIKKYGNSKEALTNAIHAINTKSNKTADFKPKVKAILNEYGQAGTDLLPSSKFIIDPNMVDTIQNKLDNFENSDKVNLDLIRAILDAAGLKKKEENV